ncbi:MAG: hypothetical protein PHD25_01690 [Bacteroidales bacterium]|nr:hypothetical protein [Bacteroidales bacterium]
MKKIPVVTVVLFSLILLLSGGCSSTTYTPEKVKYTTKPAYSSKIKKVSRSHSKPVVKQTYPLEKKYIIPNNKRTSSPPW